MKYRLDPKSGNRLSILGFGCMRFPRNPVLTDMKKTESLILRAVEGGVNYFDTAYIYPGSEEALGAILHRNDLRGRVFIATKLPLGSCKSREDFDRIFGTQLERLKTDHIDYYLMHHLPNMSVWNRLRELGIEGWLAGKKAAGAIGRVGFSFHGAQGAFLSLLDAYGWDFCQIQYNYMNVNYQAGAAGLKKAGEKGLPVIVMEPLLGGWLANGLPKPAAETFRRVDPELSPAAWALRWLWNHAGVSSVLSGMSDEAQLTDNLKTAADFSAPGIMTDAELAAIEKVTLELNAANKIPCTGCNYCMPCPQNVNIPGCFSAYNMSYLGGRLSGWMQYGTTIGGFDPSKDASPGRCARCGKCESLCPQGIPIMKSLETVRKRMEPPGFGAVRFAANRLRK